MRPVNYKAWLALVRSPHFELRGPSLQAVVAAAAVVVPVIFLGRISTVIRSKTTVENIWP